MWSGSCFEHGAERLHGERERDAALLGILQAVEIEQIGARDLIEHFGVVGAQFALLLQFLAGFGGLAVAQQQQGFAQRTGLFGQGNLGERVVLVVLLPGAGAHGERGGGETQDGQAAEFPNGEARQLACTIQCGDGRNGTGFRARIASLTRGAAFPWSRGRMAARPGLPGRPGSWSRRRSAWVRHSRRRRPWSDSRA